MIDGSKIAVIIPAYRVERQIQAVLERMPLLVDRIVIVDDGSTDGTIEAVGAVRDPRVLLLRHEANQGVGAAMVTGFRAALHEGADLVVKCDGDGQMDPADIPTLLEPLLEGRAEYSKGSRFHHLPELDAMPRVRLGGNIVLTLLTKFASGYWHVLDPQNGFVAIRSDVLRRLHLDRLARGYFFENDMLIRLNALEARVADVPMPSHYGDETSALRPARAAMEFPLRLIAGFFRRIFWRYVFYDVSPVALFLLVGAALFFAGSLLGSYFWIHNALLGRATPTGTVILAAMPIILGFELLLQALVLDVQNSPRADPLSGRGKSPSRLEAENRRSLPERHSR